jgi:transcriptional regulator with XRE-family HTH domain
VSNGWDYEGLRTYVISRAERAGIAGSQADLARATGIDATKLSKWFRGQSRPTPESLRQLAATVPGVDFDKLMALAGHVGPPAGPVPVPELPPLSHPVARQLDHLLSPDSPLSDGEREALERVVARIVDSHLPAAQPVRRRRTA